MKTEPDLMTIGGKCLIERSVLPFCHVMESGWLTGKRVSLDEESRVGCHSVLLPEVFLLSLFPLFLSFPGSINFSR